MEYQLIRSRRKTLEISVKPGGLLVVRAPMRLSKAKIEEFLLHKQQWILQKQKQMAEKPIEPDYSPEFWALVRRYDAHFPGKRPG